MKIGLFSLQRQRAVDSMKTNFPKDPLPLQSLPGQTLRESGATSQSLPKQSRRPGLIFTASRLESCRTSLCGQRELRGEEME